MTHRLPRRLAALAGVGLCAALAACDAAPTPLTPADGPDHSRATSPHPPFARQLGALRRATARFHDAGRAAAAGYDTPITPCWAHRTLGAMGYHYADPDLIDGTVSLLHPETLMYEPGPHGRLRLVGLEYIVPIDAWEGDSPPTLLGQELHPHPTLPIYKLHVWLWRQNPRGLFADWNPKVSCAHAAETEVFD